MNHKTWNVKRILKRHKSGQVLLITIMLIAVVLTVVLSITFTSRTETQLTKLEEENQKALAAAEAGIEAALKSGTITATEFKALNVPSGFEGKVDVASTGTPFVSPYIAAGQQYTFYLANYPDFSGNFTGTIRLHYGSASNQDCNKIALEVTIISGSSPYSMTRSLADTYPIIENSTNDLNAQTAKATLNNVVFNCRTSDVSMPAADVRFMLVRTIGAGSKLGFASPSNIAFNSQGNYIDSEAKSPSGVTKKVQLFQSYPQIPSDFWVTSF